MPEGFSRRNRSWWCDGCGDQVAEAADPLSDALLREHMPACTGRRARQPRSSGYWMGGPARERRR